MAMFYIFTVLHILHTIITTTILHTTTILTTTTTTTLLTTTFPTTTTTITTPTTATTTGAAINPLNPGYLYLAINSNCSIYTINLNTGDVQYILSDNYTHRPHSEYEMEGLTFWDLRQNQPNFGIMHMFGNFMTIKEKGIHSYTLQD